MKSILEQTLEEIQGKENPKVKKIQEEIIKGQPNATAILNGMERRREIRESYWPKRYAEREDDNLRGIGRY